MSALWLAAWLKVPPGSQEVREGSNSFQLGNPRTSLIGRINVRWNAYEKDFVLI